VTPEVPEEYKPKMTPKLAAYLARSEQGKTTDEDRYGPRLAGYLARREREEKERESREAWDASINRLKEYTQRHVAGRRRRRTPDK
jgi:hypothetical protein